MLKYLFLLISIIWIYKVGYCQTDADTLLPLPQSTQKAKPLTKEIQENPWPNPKTAAWLSAVVPGAGQAYNTKFWKIPLIYAGIGFSGFFIYDNNRKLNRFQTALDIRFDGDSTTIDAFPTFTDSYLRISRDFYRRNRDLSIIAMVAVYGLNILDALVDAHLMVFNIKDDLQVTYSPMLLPQNNELAGGINIGFSFSNQYQKQYQTRAIINQKKY